MFNRKSWRSVAVTVVTAVLSATLVATATAGPATAVTPVAKPTQPFLESATSIGLGEQVTWQPNPAEQSISGYTVTATPVGTATAVCPAKTVTVSASNTAANVTGLCVGVAYTSTVTAINAGGASVPSNPSGPTAPLAAQTPDAPLVTSAIARNQSAIITWNAPTYSGGQPVTGYVLTVTGGRTPITVAAAAAATSSTVTGLVNGTVYTFALVAQNSVGSSPATSATAKPSPAYAPTAPTALTATPNGSGKVTLTWAAPANDGGTPVTGYTVSYQRMTQAADGSWTPATGAATRTLTTAAAITTVVASDFDATPGSYQFAVTAKNAAGISSQTVTPAPVSPVVQTKTAVRTLSAPTVAALTSVTDSSLTWASPASADVAVLAAGNVIVAPPGKLLPAGTLRKVTQVQKLPGSVVVTTKAAALSDAFTSLTVANSSNPAAGLTGQAPTAGQPRFTPMAAGVTVAPSDQVAFSPSLKIGIDIKSSVAKVSGSVELHPTLAAGIDIHSGALGFPDGADVSASAKIEATENLKISAGVTDWQTQIGELDGSPIVIAAGPVPIVLVPKVPVFLTVSAAGSITLQAGVTLGGQVSWSSRNPNTLTTKDLSEPFTVTGQPGQDAGASFSIEAGVKARAELDIYDVAGPEIEAAFTGAATVNFTPAAGKPWLTIEPRLAISAGVALHFFNFNTSLNAEISHATFPAFTLTTPPPVRYVITPATPAVTVGQSLQLAAQRSDSKAATRTWSVDGGVSGDKISSTGLFTPAAPSGRTVTVHVTDNGGVTGSTTVTVGAPFDAVQNITANQTPGQANTANLAWTAPANTGGSPVVSYRVVTEPDTGTHVATTTSATLTGLRAGSYGVSVYAINRAGMVSTPGRVSLSVDGDGGINGASFQTAVDVSRATVLRYAGSISSAACSASSCVAIGSYPSVNWATRALVGVGSGSAWTYIDAPLPADAGNGTSSLDAVSCGTSTCVAVGQYSDARGAVWPFALTYVNNQWKASRAPAAAGVARYDVVSCGADDTCVAGADSWVQSSGASVAVLSNGAWSLVKTPAPSTISAGAITSSDVQKISCGPGTCAVVVQFASIGVQGTQYVARMQNGMWRSSTVPVPASTPQATGWTNVTGVDCPAAGFCVAVGSWGTTNGNSGTLIARLTNGVWSTKAGPRPADAAFTVGSLDEVSCVSESSCIATGNYINTKYAATPYSTDILNGGPITLIPFVPTPTWPGAWTTHITCSQGECVTLVNQSGYHGAAQSLSFYRNGTWTTAPALFPGNVTSGVMDGYKTLACSASGSCVASGTYYGPSGPPGTTLDTFSLAG